MTEAQVEGMPIAERVQNLGHLSFDLIELQLGGSEHLVGHILAARGLSVVHGDERLERIAGKPMGALFALHGAPWVRSKYSDLLTDWLSDQFDVLVLGSSALLDERARHQITSDSRPIVWLDAEVPTVLRRLTKPGHAANALAAAPPLAVELIKRVRDSTFYSSGTRIQTDHLKPMEVADLILGFLCG